MRCIGIPRTPARPSPRSAFAVSHLGRLQSSASEARANVEADGVPATKSQSNRSISLVKTVHPPMKSQEQHKVTFTARVKLPFHDGPHALAARAHESSTMDSVGATARTPSRMSHRLAYDEETLPVLHHAEAMHVAAVLPATTAGKYTKIAVYGAVNAVILVPLMISFAQIIFRDPVFQPYLSELVKLTMVSGAIHQLCFSVSSTLPFAVGQVQDAGLIFLSAIASSIVNSLQVAADSTTRRDMLMQDVLATTLFTLCGSTALLGIALVVTGKLKWASFVQYLPMPVVGGYLSFIGFYCFEAGLSMMSGQVINSILDWGRLTTSLKPLLLCVPGILGGAFLFVATQRVNHYTTLPASMLLLLVLFYLCLFVSGTSLEEARAYGWIAPLPNATMSVLDIYKHFKPSHVHPEVLLDQLPTWIAMYFVVAFSSSLDVAAIEMALHKPLDHNAELQTVGWSNLVSGLSGGFTGSYIFSSTIFSMKSGVDSRLTGLLIFALEVALVASPVSIIAYVPKLFFGSLQTLIAIDLIMEWMVHARHSMFLGEYAILWCTFIIMNVWNLEAGIVLGIAGAGCNFIVSYVGTTSVRPISRQSLVKRDFRERTLLMQHRKRIVVLELDGYIFFGSSVHILNQVRAHIVLPDSVGSPTTTASAMPLLNSSNALDLGRLRTRFLVLDFERVRGIDVTAVRSCFNATKQMLDEHNITLVFATLPTNVQGLLDRHQVLEGCLVYATLEGALEACEDDLLRMSGATPIHDQMQACLAQRRTAALLDGFLPQEAIEHDDGDGGALTDDVMAKYVVSCMKPAGAIIYESGSEVHGLYLVGKGSVEVYVGAHGGATLGLEERTRIVRVSSGAWLGDVDMVLNRRHSFTAQTKTQSLIFYLDQIALKEMRVYHPRLAARFDKAILQSMALWILESHVAIRV